jgi:hypothetical protein
MATLSVFILHQKLSLVLVWETWQICRQNFMQESEAVFNDQCPLAADKGEAQFSCGSFLFLFGVK